MAGVTSKKSGKAGEGFDFEARLRAAADKMHGHEKAWEYIVGMIGGLVRADEEFCRGRPYQSMAEISVFLESAQRSGFPH